MEFLLNANVAYLLLVLGFILTLLAIVTPGTGLLEVGAFFCLALVAYIIFTATNVGLNPLSLVVLLLSLFPFIYATRKPRRSFWLGLSIVMILVGSVYLFNVEGWLPQVNPILAIGVSALAGGFIWLVVSKTLKAIHERPSHDLDSLIGKIGESRTTIHENGSVQVAGELWSARSEKSIGTGKPVRVTGRDGFVLIVEKADEK